MAYPSTLSSFTYPNPTQRLNSPRQTSVVGDLNDAVSEIEAFVGTLSSAVGTLVYDIRATASGGGGHVQTANKGGTGQTAYAKGDILVAQSSSVLAKLTVGADNQVLTADSGTQVGVKWSDSTSNPTVKTAIPRPWAVLDTDATTEVSNMVLDSAQSSMLVGTVVLPVGMVVNQVSMGIGAVTTPGQVGMVVYNELGTASVLYASTATLTAPNPSIVTVPVSSVTLNAGNYIFAVSPISSVSLIILGWDIDNAGQPAIFGSVAGKTTVDRGAVSVLSASAVHASINGLIVRDNSAGPRTPVFRLDN